MTTLEKISYVYDAPTTPRYWGVVNLERVSIGHYCSKGLLGLSESWWGAGTVRLDANMA